MAPSSNSSLGGCLHSNTRSRPKLDTQHMAVQNILNITNGGRRDCSVSLGSPTRSKSLALQTQSLTNHNFSSIHRAYFFCLFAWHLCMPYARLRCRLRTCPPARRPCPALMFALAYTPVLAFTPAFTFAPMHRQPHISPALRLAPTLRPYAHRRRRLRTRPCFRPCAHVCPRAGIARAFTHVYSRTNTCLCFCARRTRTRVHHCAASIRTPL
jgi:hypothetical protein